MAMVKILLTAIVILMLSACSSKNYDPNIIANGELLYVENCLNCHGINLQGQQNWENALDEDGHRLAPPLNGSGHTWHHPPEMLSEIIKYGLKSIDSKYEGKMVGNENLTDEEILSILEYIKSVWPENLKKEYETNHE